MEHEPIERTTREVREHLADVIGDAIAGKVTYITSNGRRVAVVIPLALAETIDRIKKEAADADA
jgi:prevent-host-death family protein